MDINNTIIINSSNQYMSDMCKGSIYGGSIINEEVQ